MAPTEDERQSESDATVLTVTTETEIGRQNNRLARVISGVVLLAGVYFTAMVFLPDQYSLFPPPAPLWGRLLFFVFGVVTLIMLALGTFFDLRGHWRLDARGVVYVPLRGSPRTLAWQDVESVRWQRSRIHFRTRSGTLVLALHYESPDRREEARQFLRQTLTSFDLSDAPVEPTSWRRIAIGVAIAVPIVLLATGVAMLWGSQWPLLALWILPYVALIPLVARQNRRNWRRRHVARAGSSAEQHPPGG